VLIECGDCGQQISSEAARCPRCGAPTASGQARRRWRILAAKVVIAIVVIAAFLVWRIDAHRQDSKRFVDCVASGRADCD
jgi:uncharacterized paraquat-inducible protein A